MQLHNLPKSKNKRPKRIGRGGKRGTYSGRGQKGQKSRAGRRIRPAERDLIIRLPKRRGFSNKPKSPKPEIFNLGKLSKFFGAESVLNKKSLAEKGLLSPRHRGDVKILGEGEISVPVRVEGLKVSEKAKGKIVAAGGKVLT